MRCFLALGESRLIAFSQNPLEGINQRQSGEKRKGRFVAAISLKTIDKPRLLQ